jgi:hypothetical protein
MSSHKLEAIANLDNPCPENHDSENTLIVGAVTRSNGGVETASNEDIFIPPPGLYFRMVGYKDNANIFSRTQPPPEVGTSTAEDHSDQWWCLREGTGDRKGRYIIKNWKSGKILFSRAAPDPLVGHSDDTPDAADYQ